MGKAIYHVIAVFVVAKYLTTFDDANNNVVDNRASNPASLA